MNKNLLAGLAVAASLTLSGCITLGGGGVPVEKMPKSPEEFITSMESVDGGLAGMMVIKEEITVNKDYASVTSLFKDKMLKCNDYTLKALIPQPLYMPKSYRYSKMTPSYKTVNSKQAIFALQSDLSKDFSQYNEPRLKDGVYIAAVEINKVDSKKTQVRYFVQKNEAAETSVYQSSKDFLEGKKGDCAATDY